MVGHGTAVVSATRQRAARAFTLVEVSVTTAVIVTLLGVVVAIMGNVGTSRARSTWLDDAQSVADQLVAELLDQPYAAIADGTAQIPRKGAGVDLCPDQPNVTCVNVRGETVTATWSMVPSNESVPGGWAPAWTDVSVTVSGETIRSIGLGEGGDGVRVQRRVEAYNLKSGTNQATIAVVADGPALETTPPEALPSVYLVNDSNDAPLTAAATFNSGGVAHIPLVDASVDCTADQPCRLAIGDDPAQWWATDQYTLMAPSVVGTQGLIEVSPDEELKVGLAFADRGEAAVNVLAAADGGAATEGAHANSVCLWAEFSDGLAPQTWPECNANGRQIIFDTYQPDPANYPTRYVPIPANVDVTLNSDPRDGTCRIDADAPVTVDAAGTWTPTGECPSWTWGRPTRFGPDTGAADWRTMPLVNDDWPTVAGIRLPVGGRDQYDMVFASSESLPAAGYHGDRSAYPSAIDGLGAGVGGGGVVLADGFEDTANWTDDWHGDTYAASTAQARGGTGSLVKSDGADAHGTTSHTDLDTPVGTDWVATGWLHRDAADGTNSVGLETASGDGYDLRVNHATNEIAVVRRDANAPTSIATAAWDAPEGAWYRYELTRRGDDITLQTFLADGSPAALATAVDPAHPTLDRFVVRGDRTFHLDDVEVHTATVILDTDLEAGRTYRDEVLADNPQHYWPLDETTGETGPPAMPKAAGQWNLDDADPEFTTGRLAYAWFDNRDLFMERSGGTTTVAGHPTNANEFEQFFDPDHPLITQMGAGVHVGAVSWAKGTAYGPKPAYLPDEYYSWSAHGYVHAPVAGEYTFGIDSDDAAEVTVDGNTVAAFYGGRGLQNNYNTNGTIHLGAGWHTFEARFDEGYGGDGISVAWRKPGDPSFTVIPASNLGLPADTGTAKFDTGQLHYRAYNTSSFNTKTTTTTTKKTETQNFPYAGAAQSWTVPEGVTSVKVDAWGAAGGRVWNNNRYYEPGLGGHATGTLSVTPGEVLTVYVGGEGSGGLGPLKSTGTPGGWNGGGRGGAGYGASGGGGTDVRQGGTALSNRRIVAGGGGGADSASSTSGKGGDGGGMSGANGAANAGTEAGGGTQTSGGVRGEYSSYYGYAGSLGQGGGNGIYGSTYENGGGGGGGYYGGGGGSPWGAGGGGSSYVGGVAGGTTTAGQNSGDGRATFTYTRTTTTTTTSLYHPRTSLELDEYFSHPSAKISEGVHAGPVNWHYQNEAGWTAKPTYLPADNFAWEASGWLYAPTTGTYSIGVDGDDAIYVRVDGRVVAGWYGGHGAVNHWSASRVPDYSQHTGDVHLTQGWHRISARMEEGAGAEAFGIGWRKPGDAGYATIPAANLATLHAADASANGNDGARSFDGPLAAEIPAVTSSTTESQTFAHTGNVQSWTVPSGVNSVKLEAWGASAGATQNQDKTASVHARGGYATGTLAVTPGQVLHFYVGGQGGTGGYVPAVGGTVSAGGWNGGGKSGQNYGNYRGSGGGGATDVRRGGTALSNRVVVAGGGGGAGSDSDAHPGVTGGYGGGLSGADAQNWQGPGRGGTQTAGGAGGTNYYNGASGTAGVGGNGAYYVGGGGGGGYHGGGGGGGANSSHGAGGGGGSSYVGGVTSGSTTANQRVGDGQLRITYTQTTVVEPRYYDHVNRIEKPARFDGISSDYVVVPDSASLDVTTGLTVDAFVTWDGPSGNGQDMILNKERSYEVTLESDGGVSAAVWAQGAGTWTWVRSAAKVPVGVETHVAVTYDQADLRFYVDGVLADTQPHPQGGGPVQPTNYTLQIGHRQQHSHHSHSQFSGDLSTVAVYDRALTAAQVAARAARADVSTPTGTAADIAGNLDGTYFNGPVLGGDGAFAGSRAPWFDGVDDFVDIGAVATPTRWTWEFWVNPDLLDEDPNANDYRLVVDGDSERYPFLLVEQWGEFSGRAPGIPNGGSRTTGGTVEAGAWSHVAVTFSQPDLIVYVDGVEAARQTINAGTPNWGNIEFARFNRTNSETHNFEGLIDEVAVYGHALDADRIAAHHAAGTGSASEWVDLGAGEVDPTTEIVRSGGRAAIKTGNNDPNGGSLKLDSVVGDDWSLQAWMYRKPTWRGGPVNRIGLEDAAGNGYTFRVDHAGNTIAVDRRDAGTAVLLGATQPWNAPEGAWYRVAVTKRAGTVTLTTYEPDGTVGATAVASDATHAQFDRLTVRGGWDYYVDDLRVVTYAPPTSSYVEDFEYADDWHDLGSGGVAGSDNVAHTGSRSLLKDSGNDPNGGYRALPDPLGNAWEVGAWLYRPTAYSSGGIDRIGLEDDAGNGYTVLVDHAANRIGVDRRDAGTPTLVGPAVSWDPPEDEWYRVVLTRVNARLHLQTFRWNGTAGPTVTVDDPAHANPTRVVVRGGHEYYVDDLVVAEARTLGTDGVVAHLPFDEPAGEISLADRVGPMHATLSTEVGATVGIPGSLDDASTAALLADTYAPSILVDARDDVVREIPALNQPATFGVTMVLPDRDEPAELLSYGEPSTNGWRLRTSGRHRTLQVEINGTVFESGRNAYAPGVWQQVWVGIDRVGPSAAVTFWVEGANRGTTSPADVGLVEYRDHLNVGRFCPCEADDLVVVAGVIGDADAAGLYDSVHQPLNPGGPEWSKARVQRATCADAGCAPEYDPYPENAACDPADDLLCLSVDAAPILRGEAWPYSHVTSDGAAHRFTATDPEGSSGTATVVGYDPGPGGFEIRPAGDATWAPVATGVNYPIPAGDDLTFYVRRPGGLTSGQAGWVTVRLVDDAGRTRDYRLGFHNGAVAYDVVLSDTDVTVDQATNLTVSATVYGPSGTPLPNAAVTFRPGPGFADATGGGPVTATSGPDGVATATLDTTSTSAGTYRLSAHVADGTGTCNPAGTDPNGCHDDAVDVTVRQTPGSIAVTDVDVAQGGRANVRVVARDRAGDPFADVRVRASIDASALTDPSEVVVATPACTTDADGACRVEAAARHNARVRSYTLEARSGSALSTGNVRVVATVQRLVADDTVIDQGGTTTVPVRVLDGRGAPVPNVPVDVATTGGLSHANPAGACNVIDPASCSGVVYSDASGVAVVELSTTATATPGDEHVEFAAEGRQVGGGTATATDDPRVSVGVRVVAAVRGIIVAQPPDMARGTTSAVRATANDGRGPTHGVAGATLRVTLSEANSDSGARPAEAVRAPGFVRTGDNGAVLVPVTVGRDAPVGVEYEITLTDAADDTVHASGTFAVVESVATVAVHGRLAQGETGTVTVSAVDRIGRPADGLLVSLVELTTAEGVPAPAFDIVGPGGTTTVDADGDATVDVTVTDTANSPAGAYLAHLDVAGIRYVVPVDVAPVADRIVAGAHVSVPQGASAALPVTVLDRAGDPMPRTPVVVAATAGADPSNPAVVVGARTEADASGRSETQALTGADGTARVPVRGGAVAAGTYASLLTVSLPDAGVADRSVDVAVTQTIRAIGVASAEANNASSGNATVLVTVSAVDVVGQPVAGAGIDVSDVRFGSNPGRATPVRRRVATDAQGQGTVRYVIDADACATATHGGPPADHCRGRVTASTGPSRASGTLTVRP